MNDTMTIETQRIPRYRKCSPYDVPSIEKFIASPSPQEVTNIYS